MDLELVISKFYSVADAFYEPNNLWMVSGFVRQNQRVLFREMRDSISFTTRGGRTVPQVTLQGNWVEQWGFEIGCKSLVECNPNKLVILKD